MKPESRRQRGRGSEMTEENETKTYRIVYQNDDVVIMFRTEEEE